MCYQISFPICSVPGEHERVAEISQRNEQEPMIKRLNVMDLGSYLHNLILRWAGHVSRMPMTRAPRQLLTGWVAHSRPNGCPEMTWVLGYWNPTMGSDIKEGPTCSEERRQLEPSLAFWSEFSSACAAQVHSACASVTALYLSFLVFGRVLTRLD